MQAFCKYFRVHFFIATLLHSGEKDHYRKCVLQNLLVRKCLKKILYIRKYHSLRGFLCKRHRQIFDEIVDLSLKVHLTKQLH